MFWKWKRPAHDFSAELEAHIALEADRLRSQGISEEDAQAQARKAFGNVTQSEEGFYEAKRLLWLDHFRKDAGYTFRQLRKNKIFTLTATLTLALGIGATISIFTLVNATLLRPLPYRDADRIVSIKDVRLQGRSTGGLVGVPRFFDLRQRTESLAALAFYYFGKPTLLVGSRPPLPLHSVGVNAQFWDVLSVAPAVGRTFTTADDRPHAPEVAVISYALWQQEFGGERKS